MKILATIIISCLLSFSTIAFSKKTSAPIKLLTSPNAKAKVIAIIPSGTPVMPIFQNKTWVKIANPKNGDVGWIKESNLVSSPIILHKVIAGNSAYCKRNHCSFSFHSSNYQPSSKGSSALWKKLRTQQRNLMKKQRETGKTLNKLMKKHTT